jgi:hypothetical protein
VSKIPTRRATHMGEVVSCGGSGNEHTLFSDWGLSILPVFYFSTSGHTQHGGTYRLAYVVGSDDKKYAVREAWRAWRGVKAK